MTKILDSPDNPDFVKDKLQEDIPWCKYSIIEGDIYEDSDMKGEEMFKNMGYDVMFRSNNITVKLREKDYLICEKNKIWRDKDYEGYNSVIIQAFFDAWDKGLL